jgi:hypothetical protein
MNPDSHIKKDVWHVGGNTRKKKKFKEFYINLILLILILVTGVIYLIVEQRS